MGPHRGEDKAFKRDDRNLLLYCAVLESFLVHARGLFEFFYDDESKNNRDKDNLRPDALLLPGVQWQRPSKPEHVKRWCVLINKRLQHVTTSRDDDEREWNEREICDHIDGLVAQLNALAPVDGALRGDRHPDRRSA